MIDELLALGPRRLLLHACSDGGEQCDWSCSMKTAPVIKFAHSEQQRCHSLMHGTSNVERCNDWRAAVAHAARGMLKEHNNMLVRMCRTDAASAICSPCCLALAHLWTTGPLLPPSTPSIRSRRRSRRFDAQIRDAAGSVLSALNETGRFPHWWLAGGGRLYALVGLRGASLWQTVQIERVARGRLDAFGGHR